MAVLALTAIGSVLGGALLPSGISLFGATLSGAALGGAIGGLAGSAIDQTLFGSTSKTTGPRLEDVKLTASTEGAPVMRVYGRMRVGGQVIWASRFRETATTETHGGKGSSPKVESTTYAYSASFAVGLCEGPIGAVGRVWADGEPLETGDYEMRLYTGTEDQLPDPKIVAVEGAGYAPAYRGLAYLVFEELPLERFGNRIPQITVEVIRRPPAATPQLEDLLTGVTLIPGASEFAYATEAIERKTGFGAWAAENAHVGGDRADLVASLDDLAALAPNVSHVSLVVAWHGTDLRVNLCEIRPRPETQAKETRPKKWRVSNFEREDIETVSLIDGEPAIGGAPADFSVFQAISELKARGLKVTLNPFVMMDVPSGNAKPDPYGGAEQAAYPWRGRITCSPAPGLPFTTDGTAVIAERVGHFFGEAAPGDFGWHAERLTVTYGGPNEWSYRRFVLHMARIAQAAGGVDGFLIGSEMVGVTRLRDDTGAYPAVAALKTLAADVRATLGPDVRIGYGADWTEFANHRPDDGSGDVIFHLDPLWADDNVDFVGIDNYAPLADWREGSAHLDAVAGWKGPYDAAYLDANVEGGELFDWFYASPADRDAQIRTPIVDTAHGEHWAFRIKDIRSWWENAHHDRPGGVRSAAPTAWVPQSKPIVFCELGCPAIDKGANQPNVFVDPKSSESFIPYFSSGRRDDRAQRAFLSAQLTHWATPGRNPVSAVTGEPMLDLARRFVWTWDARPAAAFPAMSDVWADASNWRLGHWLTGRLGSARLSDVIADIGRGLGVAFDLDDLDGQVRGYTLDRVMSAREAIEPLIDAFGAEALARGAAIRIANRKAAPVAALTPDDLADGTEKTPAFRMTRAQASEIPQSLKLRHVDPDADFRQSAVEARRLAGEGRAVSEAAFPLALTAEEAQGLADGMLIEASVARERGEWTLPPGRLALEPGDRVAFTANGRTTLMRLDEVGEEFSRPVKATRDDPDARDVEPIEIVTRPPPSPGRAVAPVFDVLDLPLIVGDEPAHAPRLAAYAAPWTPMAVYRADDGETYALDQILRRPATLGVLTAPLGVHASGRFDRANALEVEIGPDRTLESRSDAAVLKGANMVAVRGPSGGWEVLQFATAELVGAGVWRLTRLLRGQFGTEDAIGDPTPAGASFALIDARTPVSTVAATERGLELPWRAGPATRPRNHATYVATTARIGARGLMPLSPVHVSARRDPGSGDVTISWIRRTRIGGDDFDARDARLGEDVEAYEVDILVGSVVARTIEASSPAAVYAHGEQMADFGAAPDALDVAVRQLSATVGAGVSARATLAL
ncbi:baseplate multidomain protein megatron [Hansschlegelia sp. KR7-227]|uniref:baseplate multidomain protein megatron n=1 Tax=Hansschlegelia sp. KR7-227 TaxID=3400914 RepID=UPI003C07B9CD